MAVPKQPVGDMSLEQIQSEIDQLEKDYRYNKDMNARHEIIKRRKELMDAKEFRVSQLMTASTTVPPPGPTPGAPPVPPGSGPTPGTPPTPPSPTGGGSPTPPSPPPGPTPPVPPSPGPGPGPPPTPPSPPPGPTPPVPPTPPSPPPGPTPPVPPSPGPSPGTPPTPPSPGGGSPVPPGPAGGGLGPPSGTPVPVWIMGPLPLPVDGGAGGGGGGGGTGGGGGGGTGGGASFGMITAFQMMQGLGSKLGSQFVGGASPQAMAGTAVGGTMQSIGMATGNPLLIAGGALVETLGNATDKLKEWNEALHKNNIQFAEFSSAMTGVKVRQEIRDIFYSQARGNARAESADLFAQSAHALKESLAPLEDSFANFKNDVMVRINDSLITLVELTKSAMEAAGVSLGAPVGPGSALGGLRETTRAALAAYEAGIPARFRVPIR